METQSEEYLTGEVISLQQSLAAKTLQLDEAQKTIDKLETIMHRAARIAGHIPFLCRELPEVSIELDNAASQLSRLLVLREV